MRNLSKKDVSNDLNVMIYFKFMFKHIHILEMNTNQSCNIVTVKARKKRSMFCLKNVKS